MTDSHSDALHKAAILVEQGIAAFRAGDTAQAYSSLREAVTLDPNNERGWLWLAGAVGDDQQRRYCLERVLAINPGNTAARRGLESLIEQQAQTPEPETAAPAPAPQPPAARPSVPAQQTPYDPLNPSQPSVPREPAPSRGLYDPLAPDAQPVSQPRNMPPEPVQPSTPVRESRTPQSEPLREPAPIPEIQPGPTARQVTPAVSERPDIPLTVKPRRASRGPILGLAIVAIVVLLLIAGLIYTRLNSATAILPTMQPGATAAPTEAIPTEAAPQATAIPTEPTVVVDQAALLKKAEQLTESGDYQGAI
ncbi:MAG TPA: hypothetical protein VFT99_14400, partial [Roseiflexaceae bacterium]|nr:hypothetical protein [Roseiflexaceae bacterium]